jgi:signal transduction histidine kinase
MRSSLGRYLAVRALIGGAVAILLTLPATQAPEVLPPVLAGLVLSSTLLAGVVIRLLPGSGRPVLFVLTAFDLVTETVLVGATGVGRSPFVLLFTLTIASAGLSFGLAAGLGFAGAAALGYWTGILRTGATSDAGVGLASFCLLLLGLLAGLLGRRVASERREIARVREELAQAQLDAESIVASLQNPLLCLDREGRIRRANPPAVALLRLVERPEGAPLEEGGDGDRLAPLCALIQEALGTGEASAAEVSLPGDPPTPVEVQASPVCDHEGGLRGLVLLLNDLTRRKLAEAEHARRERLAVIGELSGHLAHEIRNSLKPVVGSIELLQEEIPGNGVSGELMAIIMREAESLESFLTDFLTFARDKTLTLSDFDLDELIREEVAVLTRHPARAKGVRILADEGPEDGGTVHSDRGAVREVLRNIALNALEATAAGTVTISWRPDGDGMELIVEDTGAGLPDVPPETLFEPFCTHKAGGTGLGLSIARRLARRLGGEVTLERRERGACARFALSACRVLERAA